MLNLITWLTFKKEEKLFKKEGKDEEKKPNWDGSEWKCVIIQTYIYQALVQHCTIAHLYLVLAGDNTSRAKINGQLCSALTNNVNLKGGTWSSCVWRHAVPSTCVSVENILVFFSEPCGNKGCFLNVLGWLIIC